MIGLLFFCLKLVLVANWLPIRKCSAGCHASLCHFADSDLNCDVIVSFVVACDGMSTLKLCNGAFTMKYQIAYRVRGHAQRLCVHDSDCGVQTLITPMMVCY